jgi:general secretion pathway protein A
MYLSHFHLSDEPFAITSDPRFLWLSPHHEEALAHLLYAVQQRKGFAVLTGDIGTGKTTIINSALDRLGDTVRTAVIYNASLDTDELLHYIFRDFGLEPRQRSRSEAIIELNDWLMCQAADDVNAIIVVDEAQNLSLRTLEDLRLLSNMETARRKLLQILLVGQPELNDKLASAELAQLQQRIAIRCHLRPFQPGETQEYVRHRFRIVGGDPDAVFQADALARLHHAAEGVPRVINQICDTTLLRAYIKGRPRIDEAFLEEVLREDFAYRDLPSDRTARRPVTADDRSRGRHRFVFSGFGRFVPAVLALALVVALGLLFSGRLFFGKSVNPQGEASAIAQAEVARLHTQLAQRDSLVTATTALAESLASALTQRQTLVRTAAIKSMEIEPANRSGWVKFRIRRDDTLTKIAYQMYGQCDWRMIDAIMTANPYITNPNTIRIGDELLLPPSGEQN